MSKRILSCKIRRFIAMLLFYYPPWDSGPETELPTRSQILAFLHHTNIINVLNTTLEIFTAFEHVINNIPFVPLVIYLFRTRSYPFNMSFFKFVVQLIMPLMYWKMCDCVYVEDNGFVFELWRSLFRLAFLCSRGIFVPEGQAWARRLAFPRFIRETGKEGGVRNMQKVQSKRVNVHLPSLIII